MQLYNLGKIPWEESQLIYHSLAIQGREALCLVSPASPYVCIGFHQDVEQEVDLDFCRQNNIPVFRREVGGGAVFLDGNQLFFQLILKEDNPIVPKRIDAFYKKFLQPLINVHHRIGIPAKYKPVNDLVVKHRKISGTGAGEIGDSIVFVGNLILDFDYDTMARVLKIPDEKFRDKIKKTIRENLSTIRLELGRQAAEQWSEIILNNMMAEEFSKLTGFLETVEMDDELLAKINELRGTMLDEDWLYQRGKRRDGRIVKIKSGLAVVQKMYKAAGGLLRAEFCVEEGRFQAISLSGDYFCFPHSTTRKLESSLEDTSTKHLDVTISKFYKSKQFEMPGIDMSDWIELLKV